ncbi:hypothetical protein GCM10010103_67950 [Streptomyces paradoxus]
MPARRGPVADRGGQGRAAGGQGDAQEAVGRGGLVGLAYPAAEQVLHGGGLGDGVRVGMRQGVRAVALAHPLGRFRHRPLMRDPLVR